MRRTALRISNTNWALEGSGTFGTIWIPASSASRIYASWPPASFLVSLPYFVFIITGVIASKIRVKTALN